MLKVENISYCYGRRPALSGVSLKAGRGILGLVGENGAGKTTLLQLCGGMLGLQKGAIAAGGTPLTLRTRRTYLGKVAYMPQAAVLPRRFTALEYVTYLGWMRGLPAAIAAHKARESLNLVGLSGRCDEPLGRLSGGMQRRVWLAQALVAEPDVLLLDEPSTGLDPKQRALMVEALRPIGERCAVVLSSHIVEDVAQLAQQLVVLREGRVAFSGEMPPGFDAHTFLGIISRGSPEGC